MNNLEDEVINEMSKKLCSEIDFEILTGMLCELGWRKIILRPMTLEDSHELDDWTKKHVKGHFETMGLVWVFEHEDDANWFALRWL
jgi:hypothetical protein